MDKFMKAAIAEATKGIHANHGGPFGAVVVKDGKIVGRGHNKVIKNQDPTCHGEMEAIRNACKRLGTFDLSGCDIYTTSEPCPMCLGGILWANIRKVYYGCTIIEAANIGFRDEKFYELLNSPNKSEFLKELNRDECIKLFNEYQSLESKTSY